MPDQPGLVETNENLGWLAAEYSALQDAVRSAEACALSL